MRRPSYEPVPTKDEDLSHTEKVTSQQSSSASPDQHHPFKTNSEWVLEKVHASM
jgi:hypothetical protein